MRAGGCVSHCIRDDSWRTTNNSGSLKTAKAAALCNQTPAASDTPLWLGVDLGTCDVVSMVVDGNAQPVAVCLDWADVVRDGIVWDFFGAVTLVRRHLDTLNSSLAAALPTRRPRSAGHRPAYFDQRAGVCWVRSQPRTG